MLRLLYTTMPIKASQRLEDCEALDCEQQIRSLTEFVIRALERHGITAFAWDRPDLPILHAGSGSHHTN